MYEDYYSILELSHTATESEIKESYRKLAKKWHPDVNKSENATSKMQEIVSAYLILKDFDARKRYDKIHEFYFRQKKEEPQENTNSESNEPKQKEEQYSNDIPKKEYQKEPKEQHDPILDDWILKAKQQAKDFVFQSVKDAKGIATSGCKYTAYAIGITLVIFVAILILIFIWGAFQ